MNPSGLESTSAYHVVAIPFPGRSHISPMMNFCKFLACRRPDILISVVVPEDCLGFIGSDAKPDNIRFAVPDAGPPERLRSTDFPAFYEAVITEMEAPVERLLDRLQTPATAIVADVELHWGVNVGERRNIPVALFWTMPASFFTMLHFFNLFAEDNKILPNHLSEEESEVKQLEHIPGLSSANVADLQTVVHKTNKKVLKLALDCISQASKAQYLLFTSVYELEPQAMDMLRSQFSFPVYPIGPAIPYLEPNSTSKEEHNYFRWLNSQPSGSVLYVSFGNYVKISSAQMDEFAHGLCDSGIKFLLVAKAEASRLKEICGDMGLVVPWCDQLKVLCHSSVGGFWTHCGWNSTLEAVFGGIPMLTLPFFLDQLPNMRQIVEYWKIGWRVEIETENESLMKREKIAELVKRFMDHKSDEGKEMRKRARELRDECHQAIAVGGSSDNNLNAFIKNICNTRPIGHH